MSLLHAIIPAQRDATAPRPEDLRRVERLDRQHLAAAPGDDPDRVASATSGWAARLALRVGPGRTSR